MKKTYLAISKNSDNSSSGGIFPLVAEYVISKGGWVCAARYNENLEVVHELSNKLDDIKNFVGSKYVKSQIGDSFSQIKNILEKNIDVLFVGTPCQVKGLTTYLKKPYENLLTIDLVCHAAPSIKAYKKYLDGITKKNGKIKSINFRYKNEDKFLNNLLIKIETENTTIVEPNNLNIYYRAFLSELISCDMCTSCKFANPNRIGDITLGDGWGAQVVDKKLNPYNGVSLVIINNKKAESVLQSIKKDLSYFAECDFSIISKYNPIFNSAFKEHDKKNLFIKNLDRLSFKKNVEMCLDNAVDVGIMNYWFSHNYGAALTAYALQEIVLDLGYSAKVIDNSHGYFIKNRDKFYKDFEKKYLNISSPIKTELDFIDLNKSTDIFIVGSDQVFRIDYQDTPELQKYFLNFCFMNKKKIAFSASFGNDYLNCSIDKKNEVQTYLNQFDYISTREKSGQAILDEYFNIKSDWVIDPVFMVDKSKWLEIIKDSKKDFKNKPVSYILDYKKEYDDLTKNCYKITKNVDSIADFLKAFYEAEYIITNSFHGICFAIIFNKPFYCIKNKNRGNARFDDLNEIFNINDNFNQISTPDYDAINLKIESLKKYGIEWLDNALKSEKKYDSKKILDYALDLQKENYMLRKIGVFEQNIEPLPKWRKALEIFLGRYRI